MFLDQAATNFAMGLTYEEKIGLIDSGLLEQTMSLLTHVGKLAFNPRW